MKRAALLLLVLGLLAYLRRTRVEPRAAWKTWPPPRRVPLSAIEVDDEWTAEWDDEVQWTA